ncbi:MAG: glycosyltransferase family 39 protein, partial [Pirellulales bacterium]|nr:glycosyltransferase family 39 protein [Pirellulales bacterium]
LCEAPGGPFRQKVTVTFSAGCSREAIERDWRYVTQIEGHPAGYGIVIAAGRALSSGWLGPLTSARFGAMLLFGLAAGVLFFSLARQFSVTTAALAVGVLLLLPRLFAHLHFASYDGPLTSCWILAAATFPAACNKKRWAVVFGVTLGMTLSMKFTGWLAPVGFVAWTALFRDRGGLKALAIGVPVAVLVFFVFNPPLWHAPIQSMETFFRLNLDRGQHGWNIPTQFLGEIYHVDRPLPWYNTLFWTAVTVPLPLLTLMIVGLVAVARDRAIRRPGMLVAANWLVLLIVRALPGAPPHDGVRLFLPSFAFAAVLAGIGAAWLLGRLKRGGDNSSTLSHRERGGRWRGRLRVAVVVLCYVGSATSLWWYAPQWLSYYNLAIGGLPGATARGMEPTYYWDGLDASVLDWLNANTPPGEKVRFGAGPGKDNLTLLRQWGLLQPEVARNAPGPYRWYVLQFRPSGWTPADRRLLESGTPALIKTIRPGGLGPWRLDVPLVAVYPYSQYVVAGGK